MYGRIGEGDVEMKKYEESLRQLTVRLLHQILKQQIDSVYSVRDRTEAKKLIKRAEEFFKHWESR